MTERRKIVLVYFGDKPVRQVILEMIELTRNLAKEIGINNIRFHKCLGEIRTRTCTIRAFMNYDLGRLDRYLGCHIDECFGFPECMYEYFHFDTAKEPYEGTIIDYVKEMEGFN